MTAVFKNHSFKERFRLCTETASLISRREGENAVRTIPRIDLVKGVVASAVDDGDPDYPSWFRKLGYSSSFTGEDDGQIQQILKPFWRDAFVPWREGFMNEDHPTLDDKDPEDLYQALDTNDACMHQDVENSSGEESSDSEEELDEAHGNREDEQKQVRNRNQKADLDSLLSTCRRLSGENSPRLEALLKKYIRVKSAENEIPHAADVLELPPLPPLAAAPETIAESATH